MHRLLKTVPPLLVLALTFFVAGCSTLYRPVYSPGRSHYKKPPEKAAPAELLPPAAEPHAGDALALPPAGGGAAPAAPPAGGAAPAIPGMDAMPAIPGLPPP